MMKLYHNPLSPNGRKVTATIAHLGLGDQIEFIVLSPFQGETRTPEFLGINPNAKVPALVDGDFKLWESNAIAAYLADKRGDSDFWPSGQKRFDVARWLLWEGAHLAPALGTFIFENLLKSMLGMGSPDVAKLEQGASDLGRYGKVLDEQLNGRTFLIGGNAPSVADFCVAALFAYAGPAKMPIEQFPNIVGWLRRLDEVPAWAATAHKMG